MATFSFTVTDTEILKDMREIANVTFWESEYFQALTDTQKIKKWIGWVLKSKVNELREQRARRIVPTYTEVSDTDLT